MWEEAIISKLRKLKALADRGEQGEAIEEIINNFYIK